MIADNAVVTGDVRLSEGVNIWHGAVLRGDITYIKVGRKTNIQDNTVVHVDYDLPTIIGNGVTIGHSAVVHGATIQSDVLIGMGAIVLSGAEVSRGSVIGAGAVVKENEKIPPFSLVVGIPGKVIRELDRKIIEEIKQSAEEYLKLAEEQLK